MRFSGQRAIAATEIRRTFSIRVYQPLPEDVGRIAERAGVKTLVLSHFVPGDDPSITDEQWSEGARKYFKGQIIVGKDLLEI